MKKTVSMRRALLLGVWMAASAVTLVPAVGLAAPDISINIGPPPPRVELAPPTRRGFVWAPGYWAWRGHRHVWIGGRWMHERRGFHWVAAHWDRAGPGWHFVPGHWQR
ncbi:MAG TPA: YXWGXW repeat-containing protein [Steroidobacteraceae bacterium]|jgi:hypothetical protein|nr:YXWGXW repeat-containing protein [Steroidobacteraceae bacterium]